MCLLPAGQAKLAAWLYTCPSTLKYTPDGFVEIVMLVSAVWARKAKDQQAEERREQSAMQEDVGRTGRDADPYRWWM